MIIVPPHQPIVSQVGMNCRYQLWAVNKFSGHRRKLGGVSKNIMLLSGMNEMANRDWATYVQLGTGSTAPTTNDTALEQWKAGTNNIIATSDSAQATPPYYGRKTKTFRFSVGAATGNISEFGLGWASSGSTIVSRARVVDGAGNPTTQTVLADEFPDVDVEVRYYPPLVDASGVVTLNGITYDWLHRAAWVTNTAWSAQIGTRIESNLNDSAWKAYDGTLGTITQLPDGLWASHSGSMANLAYQNNSYQKSYTVFCDINGWRLLNGIRSIVSFTSAGIYQTQFSAQGTGNPIPKTTSLPTYQMNLQWFVGWANKSVPV